MRPPKLKVLRDSLGLGLRDQDLLEKISLHGGGGYFLGIVGVEGLVGACNGGGGYGSPLFAEVLR